MFASAMVEIEAVLGREGDVRLLGAEANEGCFISGQATAQVASLADKVGKANCDKRKDAILNCSKSVRDLHDAIKKCSANPCPKGVSIVCRDNADPDPYDKCKVNRRIEGYVAKGKPCEIILCADNIDKRENLCQLVAHELVHSWDWGCKGNRVICDDMVCSEIRAFTFNCSPVPPRYKSFRECIRDKAQWSVYGVGCTLQDLDNNLERCMITKENPWDWPSSPNAP